MKYLIAVDASDNSKFAFNRALKNFFQENDHVYILTVAESPTSYPFEDILNFTTDTYNEMNQKIEQMYSEMLKKYGRRLTRANIPHTCLIARGTIRDVICRQAQDLLVDIVIMGRRGLGQLERTFIGSTSQYCVHNLNCSVIVIPFTAKDKLSPEREEEIASEQEVKQENIQPKEMKQEFRKAIKCDNPNCRNEYCSCKPCSCSSAECTDSSCSCKNSECAEKHGKFEKIGQYEREKWQQAPIGEREALKEVHQAKADMKYEGGAGIHEKHECNDPLCNKPECLTHGKLQHAPKGEGEALKEARKSKEELKYEGGAGKLERLKISEESKAHEKQECNDPLCNKPECVKHGKWQGKVHEKHECNDPLCNKPECVKHGKWQGKVHEKKECNDPLCSKPECEKHGKKGVDVNESSFAHTTGAKSYAEVVKEENVSNSPSSEKWKGDVEKKEHKGAINVGAGKIEGKIESKKDEDKWKGSVEVGYKGKDDQGKEYQGKKVEASIETK